MIILVFILFLLFSGIFLFMQSARFGAKPSGNRLEVIKRSPNYRNNQFQNQTLTPQLTEGSSFFSILIKFFFSKTKDRVPSDVLPSKKTELRNLDPQKNILVWFGHSSYFIQLEGKTILVDPVFSGNASPLSFTTKSFKGSDIYEVDDLPPIDYLFITHDHWDHLDYRTVLKLKGRVKKIITSLGVGVHLERWGFDQKMIAEGDWNQEIKLDEGWRVFTTTARHFSGRGFKRNGTLWSSFVLKTAGRNIFIGGDSGYGRHFADIGRQFGPFDLAILEDGQYGADWKYIHMTPEETVQAAIDLGAKKILPVHWAKFSLSIHSWKEPIIRIQKEALIKNMPLIHPMIGEMIDLDSDQSFANWWEGIY